MFFLPRNRKAFTLIEVLLAASLTAVVGLAIYSNFSSGVNVMRRLAETSAEEDLAIFFEKFDRELENSFHQKEIPFEGEKDKFSFATTVLSEPLLGGERGIGRVTYSSSQGAIVRRQQNVHDIFDEKDGAEKAVLQGVSDFHLEYFGYESSESRYLWSEDWDPVGKKGTVPIAVKVQFLFKSENGETRVERNILIPVAD